MSYLLSNKREPFIPRMKTYLSEKYVYYKQVLDRIKFAGAILLVMATAFALSLALSIHEWNQMNATQCDNMTNCIALHDPICNFTKQFNLTDEYRLSVCSDIQLDLRRYFDQQPSATGINMNRKQFDDIVRLSSFVYKELNKDTGSGFNIQIM